jgi:hypothetical protein
VDLGRILELMKACHLVFVHKEAGQEDGIIVPDRLKPADVCDKNAPDGSWKYTVDFLPEKVFLRFIEEEYNSIEQRADRFFRNQLDWNTTGGEIRLEAHYSPPGNTRPYILIRSAPERPDAKKKAEHVKFLFDQIYKKEGLRDIKSELVRVGESEQPTISSPMVSQGLTGLARFGKAFLKVKQLRYFYLAGVACQDQEEPTFKVKALVRRFGSTESTLAGYLDEVVDLFRGYFAEYGHPDGLPKGRGPFQAAKARDEANEDAAKEEDRVLAVEGGSGWRICEPAGRWAWELTKEFLIFVREVP